VKRELARLSRPAGAFDAAGYFRGDERLRFYNVGTGPIRAFAAEIYRAQQDRFLASALRAYDER